MADSRADEIMLRMGFPPSENGPYVSELRKKVAEQVAAGLISRSGGTWAPDCYEHDADGCIAWKISHEQRAKHILAAQWEIEHGHSYEVRVLEPPIRWVFNTRTMRRSLRIYWRDILPWLGDRFREAAMLFRVWRDRKMVNPYT